MLSNASIELIRELLNEGLSNVEIAKRVRRFGRASPREVKNAIDAILDEEVETASGATGTSDESYTSSAIDEDSEEEEEDDADDEDYVEEEDEDSEEEDGEEEESEESEESETMSSASSEYDYDDVIPASEIVQTARIYLTQKAVEGNTTPKHDQIILKPVGQGLVEITYFYDIPKNRRSECRTKNRFTCCICEATQYIRQILKLVSVDQKPFGDVEIMIPYYPTTTLTPSALKKRSKRKFIAIMFAVFAIQADNDLSPCDICME